MVLHTQGTDTDTVLRIRSSCINNPLLKFCHFWIKLNFILFIFFCWRQCMIVLVQLQIFLLIGWRSSFRFLSFQCKSNWFTFNLSTASYVWTFVVIFLHQWVQNTHSLHQSLLQLTGFLTNIIFLRRLISWQRLKHMHLL